MDPRQLEQLAKRLGDNANDTEALNAAYAHGQTDPRGYAVFLEKAGALSVDPHYGAHWFCEAATVWTHSLNDAIRAERALSQAVDKEPLHQGATDRLLEMYREKANTKAVAALHERRAKAIEAKLEARPDLRDQLASIYAELARVFVEELQQPDKAVGAYQKAAEFNPNDAYSIYQARELLKAAGRSQEAIPLFAAEQALISGDPARQAALYADEANVCREIGDTAGLIRALRGARSVDAGDDPGLKQQLGSVILEQKQAGAEVSAEDVAEAEALFVSLAETYDGEYGHSYSVCALELNPANDRAAQLAMYYGAQIGKSAETAHPIATYLAANPQGLVAEDARAVVAEALSAGGDDTLIAALTPADDAEPQVKAAAFGLIARSLKAQGREGDASDYFRKVVEANPGDEEAVAELSVQLRGSHDAELRDLLLAAAKVESAALEQRQVWLSEVAALCEGPLGDVDGAIAARQQLVLLDPSDDEAADHLETTLEQAGKWDDLAQLIARRAEVDPDPRSQLDRETRVAEIHLEKRADKRSAALALARAARIEPDEEPRAFQACDLFEAVGEEAAAIELLSQLLGEMLAGDARANYSKRLGVLLEKSGKFPEAGGAFAEAASSLSDPELWAEAERCFAAAEAWEQAARSVAERADLTEAGVEKAKMCATQASYLERLGDSEGALGCLRESLEQDPSNHEVSAKLEEIYVQSSRFGELVSLLLKRADNQQDENERAQLRKRAAFLQRDELHDEEGMRQALLLVLGDVEDAETLALLASDAETQNHAADAIEYLRRLAEISPEAGKPEIALRMAHLLEDAGDEAGALEQFELALQSDPDNLEVLSAVAHLKRGLGDAEGAAVSFSQLIERVDGEQKLASARVLVELLAELDRPKEAIAACAVVLSLDAEDLEAVARARDLAEQAELWEDFVKYQQQLVDVEGDEEEASEMSRRLAQVLEVELQRADDAMRVLEPFARAGDASCRAEFERIGDAQGKQVEVAEALVEWVKESAAGPKRNEALKAAYDRFVEQGRDAQAIEVGLELVRQKRVEEELAASLEEVATRAKHLEALQAAYRVVGRELSGPARAEEMVRQSEVLAAAGLQSVEAVIHGEQALTSAAPGDVEPLLKRLSALAEDATSVVGIYERQVSRCKSVEDRLSALARAAEVALDNSIASRVREFIEIALQTAGHGETLEHLRQLIAGLDRAQGRSDLLAAFAQVLAAGGKGARDGGKGRADYLAVAADVAYRDLKQIDQAFTWLTEALAAHADEDQLDQLVAMGEAEGDVARAASAIGVALDSVHDGPLVRMLLRRRFELYKGPLDDVGAASEDLKRLYDLSPADTDIAEELEERYRAADDHRGLVKLYEDQILRSRDAKLRAELARKVALLWQDVLSEPREAADAWRRVLRMNAGDNEAKEGLERAKQGMRKVSAAQIAAAEAQTRKEVEARQEQERLEAERRQREMEAKAAELKARHSQPPQPIPEDYSRETVEVQVPTFTAPAPDFGESVDGDLTAAPAPVAEFDSAVTHAKEDTREDETQEAPVVAELARAAEKEAAADTVVDNDSADQLEAAALEAAEQSEPSPGAEPAEATEVDATDALQVAEEPEGTQPESTLVDAADALDAVDSDDAVAAPDAAEVELAAESASQQERADAAEDAAVMLTDGEDLVADVADDVEDDADMEAVDDAEDVEEEIVEAVAAPRSVPSVPPPLPSASGSVAPPPPPSASKAPPPAPSSAGGIPPLPPPSKAPPLPAAASASSIPAPPGKIPAPPGKIPPPPGKIPPPPAMSARPPLPPPPAGGANVPPPPGKRPPPPPPGKK